ncbi:MAG: hypothetical protein KDA81_01260 [Planctomycetaceae bacterium]|nr:hypothetical protein [Planctomycetaceae bacterium]
MRDLCRDICDRHAAFRHVKMERVSVVFSQTRSPVSWGLQARLTPLRFVNGTLFDRRNGRIWTIQRLFDGECEQLYILTFYLPRFLNLSYQEKLVTVFHELYHISPHFDGDIRRFDGPCFMHTASQARYDQQMAVFVRQYLKTKPPEVLRRFLKYDFDGLCRRYGSVVGRKGIVPRLYCLSDVA